MFTIALPLEKTSIRRFEKIHSTLLRHSACSAKRGVQQNITAGREIVRFRTFFLVVTDAAGAGNEDHARWRHASDVAGVVTGSREHIPV